MEHLRNLEILIVSWSFPPAADPRAAKSEAIVTELLRLGHRVSLLTRVDPKTDIDAKLKSQLEQYYAIPWKDWPLFKVNLSKSQSWLSIHKYKRLWNGLLLKLISYPDLQAFFQLKKALREFTRDYDLCLSVDGPQQMHWAVAYTRNSKNLKCTTWIADCGDPLTRLSLGNKVAPYFKLVENWFCRNADHITVPIEQGFHYFLPKFRHKMHLVRHSLTFPETREPVIKYSEQSGIPTFVYAGNMMPYQNEARKFFKYLASLDFAFNFVTIGGNESLIHGFLEDYPKLLDKVDVKGKMARGDMISELRKFDFLVYLKFSGKHQVSFKLIDYSYANIPIFSFDGSIIDESNFLKFINGDYTRSMEVPSYSEHNSKTTVPLYLDLI